MRAARCRRFGATHVRAFEANSTRLRLNAAPLVWLLLGGARASCGVLRRCDVATLSRNRVETMHRLQTEALDQRAPFDARPARGLAAVTATSPSRAPREMRCAPIGPRSDLCPVERLARAYAPLQSCVRAHARCRVHFAPAQLLIDENEFVRQRASLYRSRQIGVRQSSSRRDTKLAPSISRRLTISGNSRGVFALSQQIPVLARASEAKTGSPAHKLSRTGHC